MNKLKGHLALIAANTIWGLYAPLCKHLLNAQVIPPLALAGLKTTGAALLFWMVSLLTPATLIKKETIDRRDWPKFVLASLMIITANQILITLGLQYSSPVDGTVLCGITPFFTIALGMIFLHQKVNWKQGLGAALGFGGMLFFVFGGDVSEDFNVSNPVLGDTLFILSQLCGAIYLVFFGDILARYSPFTMMKWMFSISAITMIPLTLSPIVGLQTIDWNVLDAPMWTELGYIIAFATFLAFLLLPVGQKAVSPTSVAMYNYLQPVVTAFSAVLMGVAVITGNTAIATLLIFAGIYFVNKN